MAGIDRTRNLIVLRIAFDGPASAGKTTTVRALGERLGRPCSTPDTAGDRTLFFDWLDYTGGLFEGYQLRCQVVSVPGQALLAKRREYLLRSADSIVYVDEINRTRLDTTLAALTDLQRLKIEGDRSVGVVLQANKRDLPDALPVHEIRQALAGARLPISVLESTATEGMGVRESFVFAVRLALDKVRAQIRNHTLEEGLLDVDDPEALLEHMRAQEAPPSSPSDHAPPSLATAVSVPSMSPNAETTQPAVQPSPFDTTPPEPPTERVASGLIWPPIDGRMCLAEATQQAPRLVLVNQSWRASTDDGWQFFSHSRSVYQDPEDGRGSLIRLARHHLSHAELLSGPRCVVLANDGTSRWRLWQIARERLSLRQRLAASLDEHDSARIAQLLIDTAHRLIELDERVRRIPASPLRVTLDTAGVFGGRTQFVGFVPEGPNVEAPRASLEDEFRGVVRDWTSRRAELIVALRRAVAAASGAEVRVIERLKALFEA
jgi:signal recognition particle receptor subunit beta